MARARASSKQGSSPTSSERDSQESTESSMSSAPTQGPGPLRGAGTSVSLGEVQAKPVLGSPGDSYEREANAFAKSVTSGDGAPVLSRVGAGDLGGAQRQDEEEEEPVQQQVGSNEEEEKEPVQTKSEEEEEPVQKQSEEEEEPVQSRPEDEAESVQADAARDASGNGSSAAGTEESARSRSMRDVAAHAIRTKGPGRPMHSGTRRTIERRGDVDLSDVRVHDGPSARSAATALEARAFTHKRDIWLGRGASDRDLSLMAHETAHVVQQGAAARVRRQPEEEDEPVQKQVGSTEEEEEEAVQKQPEDEEEDGAVQSAGIIQRGWLGDAWGGVKSAAAATGEAIGSAAETAIETVADVTWSVLERILPSTAIEFLREVMNNPDGIVGAIFEKLKDVASGIFDALANQSPGLETLVKTFRGLLTRANRIVDGLMSGDCEPLFQAVSDLKSLLSDLASDIWNDITDFLEPVATFLDEVWENIGSPIVDWIENVAGEGWDVITSVWDKITEVGSKLASIASEVASAVWGRIKQILGFGGGESDEESDGGGIVDWIKEKAAAAWDQVTELLEPVVDPIEKVVSKVQDLLPLDAIAKMQEQVEAFQENAGQMDDAAGSPDDVTENQTQLRDVILPAILGAIDSVRSVVGSAKTWLTSTIEDLIEPVNTFFATLESINLLSGVGSALEWVKSGVTTLKDWAVDTAAGLFDVVDDVFQNLKEFARPVYRTLVKIVDVLGDFVGSIKDLIVGSFWGRIPACIREKIEDFLFNQILVNVPFFSTLQNIGEAWDQIVNAVYTALRQVFVDGDLLGAAWTVFKSLLHALGIPEDLVLSLINNALKAFQNIFSDPIGFLLDVVEALQLGFNNFIDNFGTHLLGGLQDWMFGALRENGIEPPTEFSFEAVFGFLTELFDITLDSIIEKVADHVGVDRGVIDDMIDRIEMVIEAVGTGLGWVQRLATDGPAALWSWLQDQITDLWETVQSEIVEYISIEVVQKAVEKIALAVTPTGVSQVIAVLESIWSAIQAAAEYVTEMMGVVNSALEGVNAIAEGILEPAASRIENTLSRSIPVAVGFLAHQVGLGDLPRRLGTIIGSVREVVDEGLDRLIGATVGVIESAVETVRGGVSAAKERLAQWWEQSVSFTRNGETHSVGFEGEEERAQLTVSSTPTPVQTFISEERARIANLTDEDEKQSQSETLDEIEEKVEEVQDIKTRGGTRGQGSFGVEDGERIQACLNRIAELIGDLGAEYVVPPSAITMNTITQDIPIANTDRIESSTDAKVMDAKVLSLESNEYSGSQPTQKSTLWREVSTRSGEYVRGHLLNHHVHGPGSKENLTPITRSLNTSMEGEVESTVKNMVLDENKVVHYRVEAVYGDHSPRREWIPAENYIPTHLQFDLEELEREEGTHGDEPGDWKGNVKNTILSGEEMENTLPPDTNPFSEPVLKHVDLKAWHITNRAGEPMGNSRSIVENRLTAIPGIGAVKARVLLDIDAWASWEDLKTISDEGGDRLFSDADVERLQRVTGPEGKQLLSVNEGKTVYEPVGERG